MPKIPPCEKYEPPPHEIYTKKKKKYCRAVKLEKDNKILFKNCPKKYRNLTVKK